MQTFEYKVKIQAKDSKEAKQILTALFDIKKAVSTADLLVFSKAIKEKPSLVKKAKMFL
jgi:hypothetical protein